MILLFLFFMYRTGMSEAANPRFYICTSVNNKEAAGYINYFEGQVTQALKKEFPCVTYQTQSSVIATLEHERLRQFLSADEGNSLEDLGASMGCDYLISLKVSVIGNTALINALCIETRKSRAISRATASVANGSAGVDAMEKVSTQLIEGLKKYEICPFKGPINIEVKTERKDKETETYTVYCDGRDGLYRKVTEIDNTSQVNWKLNKTGKNTTGGSVSFSLYEESNIEEQNDCYKCASGRQGPRMYTEKIIKTATVQGLSNESVLDGQQIEDARAEITFNDDGTYILKVKAASKKGELKLKTERRAEGTCDNKIDPPENVTKKADVPLIEIFGPFSGTSLDKTLSQRNTISKVDPINKEKTTITFDFNLRRE